MMRQIGLMVAVSLALSLIPQFGIAGSEANFRQRMSTSDEVLASDISEEVRFGREVAARVIARSGLYENPQLMKYINLVGRMISQNTNRPELEFHFAVLDTDEINAYAAPGGYVFVTRGALAKMQDESELAGVLAHEAGHIAEKQAVREFNVRGTDDSSAAGMAHLIGGSSESARLAFSQAADKAVDMLFKEGYKREDEMQADKDAVLFCALAGYDPRGLAAYFERISTSKGKLTEVLDRTHPSYEARIAWLNGAVSQEGIEPENYKRYKDRFAENVKNLR